MPIKGPTSMDQRIGNKIRALRLEQNITQQWLGEQIGVTFQQIQKYEKGSSRISAVTLFEVCQVLNASISSMFDEPTRSFHEIIGKKRARVRW
jgi:transcriptional regulator with XRE-family HTH domain